MYRKTLGVLIGIIVLGAVVAARGSTSAKGNKKPPVKGEQKPGAKRLNGD